MIKASLNNREAGRELGRELGREPLPVEVAPGIRKAGVTVTGLFKGMVSSECAGEGLGVRTLRESEEKKLLLFTQMPVLP